MRLVISRSSIRVIPESVLEEVYLEEVFQLHLAGDQAIAERVAAHTAPSAWAYLEIKRK